MGLSIPLKVPVTRQLTDGALRVNPLIKLGAGLQTEEPHRIFIVQWIGHRFIGTDRAGVKQAPSVQEIRGRENPVGAV